VQGYNGLGTGSNVFSGDFLRNSTDSSTTLTLTNLPPHGSVNIKFLLAIIDSWDGLGAACGTSGPDNFVITIDGVTVFSYFFDNINCGAQTYIPPSNVELARRVQLGFNPANVFHIDSAYDLGLDPTFLSIPHTSNTLTVVWSAPASQGGMDESWGIDNLEVSLNTPTAANVAVAGRVLDADGRGIPKTSVTMDDGKGQTRTALTNPLGYYIFTDVAAGHTYFFSVSNKRYQFTDPIRVITVKDELGDVDFIAMQTFAFGVPRGLF
jgi:hypothetical protein